jgi:hypothetical protein
MLNIVQPFEAGEVSDDDKDGNDADMKMYGVLRLEPKRWMKAYAPM